MRGLGVLVFGLGVLVAQPALASRTLNCEADPSGSFTFSFTTGPTPLGILIHTTAETGVTLTVNGTATGSITLDGTEILAVTASARSVHISAVFASPVWGEVKFAPSAYEFVTATCTSNSTGDAISRMQTLSPFSQQNLASAGPSFQSLLDKGDFVDDGDSVEPMNFSPDAARASEALSAIDGTFSLLGYGPNALLSGNATLARGEDWLIKGIVKGSFAEADVTNGKLTQTEATAGLVLSGRLDADLRYALSVTAGLGNAEAPDQSATSRKLVIDGAFALPLDAALDLILGANWGVAHHEVNLGSATGNYNEQMASASVALRGEQSYGALTLVPTLAANLGYGDLPDYTDSGATPHAGGTSLVASADAGLKVSYDYVVDDATQTLVSPFAGVTLAAYRQSFNEHGGATTTSTGLGGEIALGVTTRFGDATSASVKTTLARRGSSTSASLSGSLSARF